jgi:DNA-binding CsgD family transcriptional regulator
VRWQWQGRPRVGDASCPNCRRALRPTSQNSLLPQLSAYATSGLHNGGAKFLTAGPTEISKLLRRLKKEKLGHVGARFRGGTVMSSINTLQERGLKPVAVLAADRPHGDRLRYMSGYRCDECRRANTQYELMRERARRNGDWNGIVSAEKVRAHLKKLSRLGVGRRAVAAASGVAASLLMEIRAGRRIHVRARTERRVLAVTKAQASDHALVPAGHTWRLIEHLVEEGYTYTEIARRLGYRTPKLQFKKKRITVRAAYAVQRLHDKLTGGEGKWDARRLLRAAP